MEVLDLVGRRVYFRNFGIPLHREHICILFTSGTPFGALLPQTVRDGRVSRKLLLRKDEVAASLPLGHQGIRAHATISAHGRSLKFSQEPSPGDRYPCHVYWTDPAGSFEQEPIPEHPDPCNRNLL